MNIKNTIILAWRVEDGDYSYQGQYEFSKDAYAAIDWDALLEQQVEEYTQWREMFDQARAQQ